MNLKLKQSSGKVKCPVNQEMRCNIPMQMPSQTDRNSRSNQNNWLWIMKKVTKKRTTLQHPLWEGSRPRLSNGGVTSRIIHTGINETLKKDYTLVTYRLGQIRRRKLNWIGLVDFKQIKGRKMDYFAPFYFYFYFLFVSVSWLIRLRLALGTSTTGKNTSIGGNSAYKGRWFGP